MSLKGVNIMVEIQAFCALRPSHKWVREVASLPYDVMTHQEALEMVKHKPHAFLRIDKPEIEHTETGKVLYEKAGNELKEWIHQGIFVHETKALYIYELQSASSHQFGLVTLVSAKDYDTGIIKQHEKTREDKKQTRIWHIENCKAHTGLVYLVEPTLETLGETLESYAKEHRPLFDETYEDGVTHRIYKLSEPALINELIHAFKTVPCLYIADGHHRAAAACYVAQEYGKIFPECNAFLAVIFPKKQLNILAYHRIIQNKYGYNKNVIWQQLSLYFTIRPANEAIYLPTEPHTIGMRYNKEWYELKCNASYLASLMGINRLDVSILQNQILDPVFHITNPRVDPSINFIPDTGDPFILNACTEDKEQIAFSLFPTSIEELIEVANRNELMPPKSTWFSPKLRSGFLLHPFDEL